jgi:choline-glycine betaine transporter
MTRGCGDGGGAMVLVMVLQWQCFSHWRRHRQQSPDDATTYAMHNWTVMLTLCSCISIAILMPPFLHMLLLLHSPRLS